ncbi:hypothetical protein BH11PSE12_BH11PSE12_03980 [soil metagenome]
MQSKIKPVALQHDQTQTTNYQAPTPATLPHDGMSRYQQFKQFCPFSREKFRQLSKLGRAPQPIRFSERCTAYSNRELHRFFADPIAYRVEVL